MREILESAPLPPLDAELLLSEVLARPRSWLLAHENDTIAEEEKLKAEKLFERRRSGEPIAYILGKKEFFGREFLVDRRVLIPRPATERLVEIALEVLKNPGDRTEEIDNEIVAFVRHFKRGEWSTILDIGSGSGCISLTLALELNERGLKNRAEEINIVSSARPFGPRAKIIGVDSSSDAIEVAKENQKKFGATNVSWVQQDGVAFVNAMTEPFVLISNPPYIPEGTTLDRDVGAFEPSEALFGGPDGMDIIRPLLRAAQENENCRGVIMEMRKEQVKFVERAR